MDSIRVDNGTKKIQVNDDGEYIQFSVTDAKFYEGFFDFARWIESEELKEEARKIDKETEKVYKDNVSSIEKVALMQKGIIVQAMEKIDNIFGSDASRKIFCGTIPLEMSVIEDFIEQIAPYIKKYASERNKKISRKYTAKRKGAKS